MAIEDKDEQKLVEVVFEDFPNEHLMKHHLNLSISATSLEKMKSILSIILKNLDESADYRVVNTPDYNLAYYKVGRIH